MEENGTAPYVIGEASPPSTVNHSGDYDALRNDSACESSIGSGSKSAGGGSSANNNSPQKRKHSSSTASGGVEDAEAPPLDADAIKMFVGQIPKTWDETDARQFFETYGVLHQIYILRDKTNHSSKGCCFVTYCTRADALRAQHLLHDVHKLPGMKHAIQMKPADNESKNERKLFVGMIPKTYTEQDVERLFCPYGAVEETSILRDNAGKSRGCAFVTFANKPSVWQSIRNLNLQTVLPGCSAPMVVKLADSQRDRDRRRSVQSLLLDLGIDCRSSTGSSLVKLFSGTQQPYASLELPAIRQLILSSPSGGGGGGGGIAPSPFVHATASSFAGMNDFRSAYGGGRNEQQPTLYNHSSKLPTAANTYNNSIISSPPILPPDNNLNNSTVAAQLLSQFLAASSPPINDSNNNYNNANATPLSLLTQQQQLPNAVGNNNLVGSLLAALAKSLAAEQASLTPSAYAATNSLKLAAAAATHPSFAAYNTGGAFGSNNNSGSFGGGDYHQAATSSSSSYDYQQQQQKRQRSSNQPTANGQQQQQQRSYYYDQQY